MAILDIFGQPADKEAYVGYGDIPSNTNKAYQMPTDQDGNVGSKLGPSYDPSEMFVDGDPVQGGTAGQNALPENNSITKAPEGAPDAPKWPIWIIGLAGAWIAFMFLRGKK